MNFKKGDIILVDDNYKVKLLGEPYYGNGNFPTFLNEAWRAMVEHLDGLHVGTICYSFNLTNGCVLFERSGTKRIVKKLDFI